MVSLRTCFASPQPCLRGRLATGRGGSRHGDSRACKNSQLRPRNPGSKSLSNSTPYKPELSTWEDPEARPEKKSQRLASCQHRLWSFTWRFGKLRGGLVCGFGHSPNTPHAHQQNSPLLQEPKTRCKCENPPPYCINHGSLLNRRLQRSTSTPDIAGATATGQIHRAAHQKCTQDACMCFIYCM